MGIVVSENSNVGIGVGLGLLAFAGASLYECVGDDLAERAERERARSERSGI